MVQQLYWLACWRYRLLPSHKPEVVERQAERPARQVAQERPDQSERRAPGQPAQPVRQERRELRRQVSEEQAPRPELAALTTAPCRCPGASPRRRARRHRLRRSHQGHSCRTRMAQACRERSVRIRQIRAARTRIPIARSPAQVAMARVRPQQHRVRRRARRKQRLRTDRPVQRRNKRKVFGERA